MVPLPRDFKSETMAIHVSQRGKAHPSEAILRTLEDKRLKYFKVRHLDIDSAYDSTSDWRHLDLASAYDGTCEFGFGVLEVLRTLEDKRLKYYKVRLILNIIY